MHPFFPFFQALWIDSFVFGVTGATLSTQPSGGGGGGGNGSGGNGGGGDGGGGNDNGSANVGHQNISKSSFSAGKIAGVVIGVAILCCIFLAAYRRVRRRRFLPMNS